MEKAKTWNIKKIFAFVIIAAIGSLLHFVWENIYLYPWAKFIAFLVPVNESYWEHSKLAVIPLLVYFIIQYFINFKGKAKKGAWAVCAAAGLWTAVISMFMIHAALIAVFGHEAELVISIITFFINVFLGMYIFHALSKNPDIHKYSFWAWLSLFILFLSVIIYTYLPLKLQLFKSTDFDYFGPYPPH